MKVYERCAEWKTFFDIIPKVEASGGWLPLLRMVRGLGVSAPAPAIGVIGHKSFAEVLKVQELPTGGSCERRLVKGEDMIVVKDVGVNERVKFMNQCLVFKFGYEAVINWVEFKVWSARNWGTVPDARFGPIGDDLWLLVCASKAEVDKILALNRRRFKIVYSSRDVFYNDGFGAGLGTC
ncbi:hypothetical protein LINGRAHAP2_LOCUS14328 [Linum grandiflorum]